MKDGLYAMNRKEYVSDCFSVVKVKGDRYANMDSNGEFYDSTHPVDLYPKAVWNWLSPLPEEWTSQPTRDGRYKLKIGQTEKEIEVTVQGRRFLPEYSSTHQWCHHYNEEGGSQWLYLGPDSPETTESKQEPLPQRALTVKLESGHLIVSLLDDKGHLLGGGSVNLAEEINAILDERMSSIRVVM